MPLSGDYEPSTSDWARENAEKYMESGGTEGTELKGRPVILLTTLGAKTGRIRKTPLMRVELQDGSTTGEYDAREVYGDEKATWWERAVEAWPDYAEYQTKTDRQIPVFVLSPVS